MASSSGASSSMKPAPVDPAVTELLNAHASAACDQEAIFQSGAVDLAVNLLGQFLFFHDTKIAVRILETEAYPEGDEVFTKTFKKSEVNVKLKGGTLLAWSPCNGVGEGADFKYLFITAGPPINGDLVHIRSCEPILGLDEIMKNRKNPACPKKKKNLLVGPTKVSEGVGAESWPDNPRLYRDEGVQLFYGARNEGEKLKHGKRILGGFGDTNYKGCLGTDSLYRFALATKENYKYSKKCGGLKDWKV